MFSHEVASLSQAHSFRYLAAMLSDESMTVTIITTWSRSHTDVASNLNSVPVHLRLTKPTMAYSWTRSRHYNDLGKTVGSSCSSTIAEAVTDTGTIISSAIHSSSYSIDQCCVTNQHRQLRSSHGLLAKLITVGSCFGAAAAVAIVFVELSSFGSAASTNLPFDVQGCHLRISAGIPLVTRRRGFS